MMSTKKSIKKNKPVSVLSVTIALVVLTSIFFGAYPASAASKSTGSSSSGVTVSNSNLVYKNVRYGFKFTLPKDWKGFTLVTGAWEGESSGKTVAAGPIISIRNPKWTSKKP